MELVARAVRTYSSYAGNDLVRLLDLLVFPTLPDFSWEALQTQDS